MSPTATFVEYNSVDNSVDYRPARSDYGDVAAAARNAVLEFLHTTGIPISVVDPASRGLIEDAVLRRSKEWEQKGLSATRYKRHFTASINLATVAFGHTHPDVQVHIALYTLLVLCIEEFEVGRDALEVFGSRLYSGSPQLDPLLDCLIDVLKQMSDYFLPYASKSIFVATIEFVDVTLFDTESSRLGMQESALPFIEYKRSLNALAGAYGFFVWDKISFPDISVHIQVIPETMIFLNYANDILSFFKEELAGKSDNYVHNRSSISKKSVPSVLRDVVKDVAASIERSRHILKGEKEKQTWENFMAGYVAYHYMSPRYRLVELLRTSS